MPEKTITGWLVVDWKTGKHKTRQSKPGSGDLNKNEIPAKLRVDVTIPEVDVATVAAEIDVPKPVVHAATLEALSDEELPDWTGTAHEVIEEYDFDPDTNAAPMSDLVDIVTAQTLVRVNTRPDPERVHEYVRETMRRLEEDEEADS